MAFTKETASKYGRVGGLAYAALYDSKAQAQRGQKGLINRFTKQVDPDELLDPETRAVKAAQLHRAYMLGLNLRRTQQRRNARIAAGII